MGFLAISSTQRNTPASHMMNITSKIWPSLCEHIPYGKREKQIQLQTPGRCTPHLPRLPLQHPLHNSLRFGPCPGLRLCIRFFLSLGPELGFKKLNFLHKS
jgi:hypothetical protein